MNGPLSEFSAATERGYGKGKTLGVPTINLDLSTVPKDLAEGVYACMASLDGGAFLPSTMHLGPRPVFRKEASCEIHMLDLNDVPFPLTVTVFPVERLRDIRNFPSQDDLLRQIQADNEAARAILGVS